MKKDMKTAILAALPALILAATAWLNADAAKRSEASTYDNAATAFGEQADEIAELRARLVLVERACVAPSARPAVVVSGNTFGPPGVANIITR